MGNLAHPLKVIKTHLEDMRSHFHVIALRDKEYDADERAFLRMLDHIEDYADEAHSRKQLAGLIEKGGDVSAYMNGFASALGMQIVPIDDYRDPDDKVVPFPSRNTKPTG